MKWVSIYYVFFFSLFISSLLMFFFSLMFLILDLVFFLEWEIFSLNGSSIVMTLIFDWMSLIFSSFVIFISSVVIYYSIDYMSGDVNFFRFILLVLMFVFSMVLLIFSPNIISILLGWDGLGLISYCLVIYYHNVKSYNAGMLTILSNRVGDVAILMSVVWMFNYGGWNYFYYCMFFDDSLEASFIILMIILAGMTKSAQIPFSSWLPAAMAAPTPVSSLVHSSTLVTAGVYLLIRFSNMLLDSGYWFFMLIVGCLTMFMSGLAANYEFDLKSVIALSTLSQLGLMMSILSMGFPILSFFHLLTHALFKALLFLCAGSYIHNLSDFQDVRYMGSIISVSPFTSVCFNVSSLSLCGMPFLAGFYSSDIILELVSMSYVNVLIFFLFFLSTGLTSMYSFRLFYYSMFGVYSFSSSISFIDSSKFISFGILGLLFVAVFGGSLISWLIFPLPSFIVLPFILSVLTFLSVLLGAYMGYFIFFIKGLVFNSFITLFNYFFGLMWFMPFISSIYISLFPLNFGYHFNSVFDFGWNELFGGQGLYDVFLYFINYFYSCLDYNFKSYILLFSFWLFILFGFMFYFM
uniref:NADH-ubiquinone oxidoreductase chain 5 n=2 Tax=Proscopia sp. HS-2014 TaxID=1564209 RepID=A0A0N7AXQ9_9ORTH|nr:NADH dehydrogenase subunit 5 [Proscopia sp. HS-2014]